MEEQQIALDMKQQALSRVFHRVPRNDSKVQGRPAHHFLLRISKMLLTYIEILTI